MLDLDLIAKAIRDAYGVYAGAVGRGQLEPWENISEQRKEKWRLMADAAVTETVRQMNGMEVSD